MIALALLVLAAPKSGAAVPAKPVLPPVAAVFVSSPDESAAATAEAELTRALEDTAVQLVDVPAAFPLPERDPAGEKLVKDARQAFDDLDYEGAATRWDAVLEFFTKHPEFASGKHLADAHFFIGALALANGGKPQTKKAQEEFGRALLHNPELTCDAEIFGADAKKVFEKAQAEVGSRAVGTVTVDSTPAGATVTWHGKVLGPTPLAQPPSAPLGRHLLLFAKPGYEPTGVFADVTKDGASAKPTLTAAPGYSEVRDAAGSLVGSGVGVKGPLPAGARKLAEVVKARFLVLSDGATAEAWDVETGNRLAGLSLSPEEVGQSAKKIAEFIASPAPIVAAAAPGKPAGPLFEGPLLKQWWFWGAVGVVAVGGATAIGVAAANNPGGRPFNVVLGIP